MKNAGKKLISLSCALAVLSSGAINALALAPSDYDGKSYESLGYTSEDPDGVINLAVIAKNDVNIYGDAMLIEGSVYSNGTIKVGNGQGNKIKGIFISGTDGSVLEDEANGLSRKCEGYIHVNDNGTTDGITYYSTQPDILGGSIMDKDTSFECEYTPYVVPEISNVVEYANGNQWNPGTIIVSEDTHYNTFEIGGEGLIVDTTNGDVTIVIDKLNRTAGDPYIKVRGNNKANIYINDFASYGSVTNSVPLMLVNESVNAYDWRGYNETDNYAKEFFALLNDPDQINLYINTSLNDVILNNGKIAANIYSNADKLAFAGGGKYLGNIYSGASDFTITGGATYVNGIVCAPNADSLVSGSGTLYGQLHTDTLTINGAGRILWKTDSEYAEIETEPTEPEVKPTEPVTEATEPETEATEPVTEATEPVTEPNIPSGDPINLFGVNYAYIFGYEPEIHAVTETDAEGNVATKYVADIYMGPNDAVTREQTAAMIMRLIDQTMGTMDEVYPVTDNISKHAGAWYERGLAYLASKGTFDGIDSVNVGPVTRGEVAKLVCFGLNLSDGAETSFTDIAGSEFKPYIEIMNKHGYMTGVSDTIFEPDRVMTRAEFCTMFNHIIGRDDMGLVAADGTEVTCELYSIVDLQGHWAEKTMLKATSAYDKDGYVDVDTRLANIRNTLDKYEAQKMY